jgi:hypothetical protein
MNSLTVMIGPTPDGWAVFLSDGRELAHFRGIAARWRASRFLAQWTNDFRR